ncbi:hypothetical protein GCM10010313_43800 [Streptomyces violarus]|nr:hypothetical protein GCM10010313_43800 [Streptomyces violarus]
MPPEIEGHDIMIAPQQTDQLVQVGLCAVQPRAQNQGQSPAATGHLDGDAVVLNGEVPRGAVACRSHADQVGGLPVRQGQPRNQGPEW